MPPLHGHHYNYDVVFLQQMSCHTATCLVHAIVHNRNYTQLAVASYKVYMHIVRLHYYAMLYSKMYG